MVRSRSTCLFTLVSAQKLLSINFWHGTTVGACSRLLLGGFSLTFTQELVMLGYCYMQALFWKYNQTCILTWRKKNGSSPFTGWALQPQFRRKPSWPNSIYLWFWKVCASCSDKQILQGEFSINHKSLCFISACLLHKVEFSAVHWNYFTATHLIFKTVCSKTHKTVGNEKLTLAEFLQFEIMIKNADRER